jgi:hypothetical protein
VGNKPSSFAKSQAWPLSKRSRTRANLPHWPDGTPKSLGNDFTAHLDGRRSIFCPADLAAFAHKASSAANVERQRAAGVEPSRLHGLSRKADQRLRGGA